jgi:hypothetical protein
MDRGAVHVASEDEVDECCGLGRAAGGLFSDDTAMLVEAARPGVKNCEGLAKNGHRNRTPVNPNITSPAGPGLT